MYNVILDVDVVKWEIKGPDSRVEKFAADTLRHLETAGDWLAVDNVWRMEMNGRQFPVQSWTITRAVRLSGPQ